MAGYAALGFFAFFVIRKLFRAKLIGDVRSGLLAFLYSTALGGILELLQQYTGRQPEVADLLADMGGSFIGIILAWIVGSAVQLISRDSQRDH
jgi:VanZ family protein